MLSTMESLQEKEEIKTLTIEEVSDLGDDCLGLKVAVNTREGPYMGVIHSLMVSDRRIISLGKVVDPETGKRLMGMRHLLFQDIIDVAVMGVDKEVRQKLMKNSYHEDQRGKQLLMKKIVPLHLSSHLEEACHVDEDVLLGRAVHNSDDKKDTRPLAPPPPPEGRVQRPEKWVVIDAVDSAFEKALKVIREENDISVGMEGQMIGRSGTLAWLNVATSKFIFLFDVAKIGPSKVFEEGLGDILMDENILKIAHDCRAMEDMLHHKFGINLKNVFDTQAGEIYVHMLNHKDTVPSFVSGLPSLLVNYLKLSPHHVFFSHVRAECAQSDELVWFERPMAESLCEGMALGVKYLRELRLVLLRLMLVDLTQVTNLYLGALRDKDSATVTTVEPQVVPENIRRLRRRSVNNSVDVHDPYITYSRDAFKILKQRK